MPAPTTTRFLFTGGPSTLTTVLWLANRTQPMIINVWTAWTRTVPRLEPAGAVIARGHAVIDAAIVASDLVLNRRQPQLPLPRPLLASHAFAAKSSARTISPDAGMRAPDPRDRTSLWIEQEPFQPGWAGWAVPVNSAGIVPSGEA
jgi:hypothetical protein